MAGQTGYWSVDSLVKQMAVSMVDWLGCRSVGQKEMRKAVWMVDHLVEM